MTDSTTTAPKRPSPTAILRERVELQGRALAESQAMLAQLQLQWEDRHWAKLYGGPGSDTNGLDLASIKTVSEDLRAWVVAGMLKSVAELRGNVIYGDGVGFKDFAKAKKAFSSPNNVAKLFSPEALGVINRAHATDGQVIFLVHKRTKEITRFFLSEMGEHYVDGNDGENVWFVRRSWNRVTPNKPQGEDVDFFYATDSCPAEYANKASIRLGASERVKIDREYTAVIWDVNKQGGWGYGIPDLVASLKFAERYTNYLKNQDRHAEALSALAWTFKSETVDGAKKQAANVADGARAGSAVGTSDVEAVPMPGASGVNFGNGEPMAAMVAAASGLTVDDLLAKRQIAASTTLDPNVKKMSAMRRHSATEFFKRIGRLLGAPNLQVIWPDLESESPFREAQMIIAAWGTGNFSSEEIRPALAQRIRIELAEGSKAPEGVLLPNNENSLPRKDIDTDSAPGDGAKSKKAGGNNSQGNDELGVGKLSDGDNEARDKGEV